MDVMTTGSLRIRRSPSNHVSIPAAAVIGGLSGLSCGLYPWLSTLEPTVMELLNRTGGHYTVWLLLWTTVGGLGFAADGVVMVIIGIVTVSRPPQRAESPRPQEPSSEPVDGEPLVRRSGSPGWRFPVISVVWGRRRCAVHPRVGFSRGRRMNGAEGGPRGCEDLDRPTGFG